MWTETEGMGPPRCSMREEENIMKRCIGGMKITDALKATCAEVQNNFLRVNNARIISRDDNGNLINRRLIVTTLVCGRVRYEANGKLLSRIVTEDLICMEIGLRISVKLN